MSINGEIVKLRSTWAEFAPAIDRLEITDDGRIWVLSGRGRQEEREGILRSYDLFDAEGRFTEVVHLALEIDKDRDMLHHLNDGRWILLRNLVTARSAEDDADDEAAAEEGEDEPLEIVCLREVANGAADDVSD